ncbi:GroES-like protein [Mycena floridula]|nr:GroES-like protein [Mycena floridula]
MTQQKALVLEYEKAPNVIHEKPIPSPGKGELLVKVRAAALNPVDWKIPVYGGFGVLKFPLVSGTDVAGEVEQIGEGVKGWAKGDRVFYQGYFSNDHGGFQQYALISANIVAKIPKTLSFSQAATIPLALTAVFVGLWGPKPAGADLEPSWDLKPRYSGPAVVIGGSGSVGQYAIQILRINGFSPIIAYASDTHAEYLKSLGASHVLDRHVIPITGLADTVRKITDTPVKLVYDAIGDSETQQAGSDSLVDGGHLVIVMAPEKVISKNERETIQVIGVMGSSHLPHLREFGVTIYEHIGKMVEAGVIVPNRVEELPDGLQEIIDGLDRLQKGVSGIKLVGHP